MKIKLLELGVLKNGYAFSSKTYEDNGKYKIITISNVTGERKINTIKCNTINCLPKDLQQHQILKSNDILISLTGNVGRVSLSNGENLLLNQRVGVFVLSNPSYTEYVFQATSNDRFEKAMIGIGQGAAQLNIGKSDIENYEIPFTSNEKLLQNIAGLLKIIDKKNEMEQTLLAKYESQKQYLLSHLFI